MSNFSHIFIRRPVLAIVVNLAILLFGGIGYSFLGVREYPSIDPPVITVRTNYAGANADIVESQITEPLEKAINGISGIRSIASTSAQGSSSIRVEFDLAIDMDAAANDVRDKVSQAVRSLPQDIDGIPTVSKADASADAIISMTVSSDTRNHLEITDYAENVLAQRLITIPGVSTVQIWGQKRYCMRLWMDPMRMAAYRISPQEVQSALQRENVELPSGKLAGDRTELSLKALGKLTTPDEFNDLVIKTIEGRQIRFHDIGHAELGPENEESILRETLVPMIGLAIVPQPGSNYIDIADDFYDRMKQIEKDLPEDLSLNIAMDNTRFIRQSVTEVAETILIAVILVVLIIFFFFRDWLVAFRPLIDIPVSLVGAFFIMYLMDYSVNVLTLLAIVLATGLVVDDGIVVTENIFKKAEKGLSPMQAAFQGSSEIFFAVIATSLTLAVVFLPVIFMEGFVGRLFREFGIVLAGAVLISAFVSLTLTPMLNARMIRNQGKHTRFYEATEPFFQSMESGYLRALRWFMHRRWLAFPVIAVCVGGIFWFGKKLPSELAPLEDRSWLRLIATAPEGVSYEYMDFFMKQLAQTIHDSVPEKVVLLSVTAPGFTGSGAVNTGFMRLRLTEPDERTRTQQQIAQQLTRITSGMTEARAFVAQEQTISTGGGGPRGGLPVAFVIQAPNFERLVEVLPKFVSAANQHPVLQTIDVDLKFNRPELNIEIDKDKAADLQVSTETIARTLQLNFSGQRFGYFTMNGKQYQVIGQVDRANRDAPEDVMRLYVSNDQGVPVPLENLVRLVEQSSPPQLYHYNRYMSATVSAGLNPGYTIKDGIDAMRSIASETLDDRFSTALTGASRDYEESSSNAWFALILALVLIYLVLAAQFESFRDPVVIMMTVPLAVAGALFSLSAFDQTINIFSQIGIIMLIGLVTKNGILIVEFANQLQRKGASFRDAIVEASALRLRPILMTSLATSLGALPIALALGAGSASRKGMGVVVVGGVLFSLVLTLFVIPAMYSYLSSSKKAHASD
ncbi:MAG: efflux RND transporter permease subunit [Saprospiraceae bacterium]|jgi:multidrug efflux pump|nr:efflux RND transporter permease subunit [Saprospiraceae bacterium]MBP9209989.1 efflux RND transporter permease subunit [Saprospiraceae bacterium]MBV6473242.1 Efflux pump membrane transporter BepE [Saprospiraceae bacterium]